MYCPLLHPLPQICGLTDETCGKALAVSQLHLPLKSLRAKNKGQSHTFQPKPFCLLITGNNWQTSPRNGLGPAQVAKAIQKMENAVATHTGLRLISDQASTREDAALSKWGSISTAPDLARKPAVAVQLSMHVSARKIGYTFPSKELIWASNW